MSMEMIASQLSEIGADVKRLNEEVYIGAPGRPSIREDLAVLKRDAAQRSLPPPPRIPSAVWKGLGAILVALAALLGGLNAQKLSQSPKEAPAMVSK